MSFFNFFKKKQTKTNINFNYAPTSNGITPVNIDWQSIDIYSSDIVMQSIRCKRLPYFTTWYCL